MSQRRRSSVASVNRENDGIIRVRNDSIRRLSQAYENNDIEQAEAQDATNKEKSMTVRQSVRLYKKAILFSMAMSLAVVMEG